MPAWRHQLSSKDGRYLILAWVARVLLFFTLGSRRRTLYLYPALPGLALAMPPRVHFGVIARPLD